MVPEPRVAEKRQALDDAAVSGRSSEIVGLLTAEAAGAGLLAFLIVASGILGERFAGETIALPVLITALSGAAGFAVLSRALTPWTACFFNPALAFAFMLTGRVTIAAGLLAAAAQIAAAFLGVMIAHLVTNTGLVQVATQIQAGTGVWAGEGLATGLFIFAALKTIDRPERFALFGALAMLALALATPSISFANPALTLARSLTDSFTAIRLGDAITLVTVQTLAALAASVLYLWTSRR